MKRAFIREASNVFNLLTLGLFVLLVILPITLIFIVIALISYIYYRLKKYFVTVFVGKEMKCVLVYIMYLIGVYLLLLCYII